LIEYKYKFADGCCCRSNASNRLALLIENGGPVYRDLETGMSQDIDSLSIYYSQNDDEVFLLTLINGATDYFKMPENIATADDTGTWASNGGLTWERTASGDLLLRLVPPEVGRNGASYDWHFDTQSPPPVRLKVKIKRQNEPNSAQRNPMLPCSAWAGEKPND